MNWLGAVRTATGGMLRHKVQAVVLGMVLLVSTASATLGLALLAATDAPFQHAFAAQDGAHLTLTVNPARADAAQLAAPAPCAGSPRRPGRSPRRRSRRSASGQAFGQFTLAGRASPGGPVDDAVLTAGSLADRTGPDRAGRPVGGRRPAGWAARLPSPDCRTRST